MKPYQLRARDIAYCAFLALLALALFLAAKVQVLPLGEGPVTFDGKYYLSIAEQGYSFDGDIENKQNIAYLPLTAAEIAIATRLVPGGNELVEVILAGVMVLFGTLAGIFSLSSGLANATAARIATLFWAGSPMAFYNFVGYSEPLFALLCVWAFVALYRDALWSAAILAALALLARPHAMVLAGFVALALLQHARWRPVEFLRGAGPWQVSTMLLPLMAYATWQAVEFGDSMAYVNALEAWRRGSFMDGNQAAVPAFTSFFTAVSGGSARLSHWTAMVASFSVCVMVAVLAFSGGAPRRVVAFYVALLAFLFLSASFDGMNIARHTFFMFPWAMIIAFAIARAPGPEPLKYVLALPALLVAGLINFHAVMRYYRGEWVS